MIYRLIYRMCAFKFTLCIFLRSRVLTEFDLFNFGINSKKVGETLAYIVFLTKRVFTNHQYFI